jgi:SAM-dependent methyltransferase
VLNEEQVSINSKFLTIEESNRLRLYINEANFFAKVFSKNIYKKNMNLYEIGSGIGLLARIFASRGNLVIASEPDTAGFGVMGKLNSVIDKSFEVGGVNLTDGVENNPKFYSLTAQGLYEVLKNKSIYFDFIYCANVVEHVGDLDDFLSYVVPLLRKDGKFRFICPNYAFPYEPHLGFFTLFSKKLTFKVRKKEILNSKIDDAFLFWQDLSWPNVWKLKRALKSLGYCYYFSKEATHEYIERSLTDEYFIQRKPLLIRIVRFIKPIVWLMIRITPVSFMPIIDCSVAKRVP